MDPAIVSALSALLGSLVGGSTSIVTAWITQATQGKHQAVSAEIRKREDLYSEFIAECSRSTLDALEHKLDTFDDVRGLQHLHELLNRMRLTSSKLVLDAADQVMDHILEQYARPKLTQEELEALVRSHPHAHDPLKPLSDACRAELKTLLRGA